MKKKGPPMCEKPDRDFPKLVCGYPLPCPHHTAIIDVSGERTRIKIPPTAIGARLAEPKLRELAKAMRGKEQKR